MTLFLTSSPTGPLDNSRYVNGLDDKNGFVEKLRSRWPHDARCLYISADPDNFAQNDWICQSMTGVFLQRDFPISCFDVWDGRTASLSAVQLQNYGVLILGGGHVPTQNAFFEKIALRHKIAEYQGLIISISAGTMNCADVVYAQPEHPGESVDPDYKRYLMGLGLTDINVLPHYQMVKDYELDGRRLFEDITYGDSWGNNFLALTDGSYVLAEQGRRTLFGEAYRISDGRINKICDDNESIEI